MSTETSESVWGYEPPFVVRRGSGWPYRYAILDLGPPDAAGTFRSELFPVAEELMGLRIGAADEQVRVFAMWAGKNDMPSGFYFEPKVPRNWSVDCWQMLAAGLKASLLVEDQLYVYARR